MTILIHSYPGANEAVARHWKYWKATGLRIVGVDTEPGGCEWPERVETFKAGNGRYMQGADLCRKLVQTLEWCESDENDLEWAIFEYDCIPLNPLMLDGLHAKLSRKGNVWCHLTGGKPWDAQANWFSHNPWVFDYHAARTLLPVMRSIIGEGHCEYGKADSSPDVFWGYACERSGTLVHHNQWKQFTRNSFDVKGSLDEAKAAVDAGVDCIHGIKHQRELEYLGL